MILFFYAAFELEEDATLTSILAKCTISPPQLTSLPIYPEPSQ